MTTLTLLGHSAAALSDDRGTVVLDPGVFSDLSGLATASAVLVTHAHADHVAAAALATVEAPIWAPAEAIAALTEAGVAADRLTTVAAGDHFDAAGFAVEALGGEHAPIHPALPPAQNIAYLIDGTVLHTGDSLAGPDERDGVEVVLLPVAAPWLKLAEAIDFARGFPNARVLPIHDGILSPAGVQLTDGILTAVLGADTYQRPAAGEAVTL